MTPTWQTDDGRVRLWLGDCLDVLPHLSGVRCTVTSPPYNQQLETFRASGFKAEGSAQWAERASSSYFDSMPEDEYQAWQKKVLGAIHAATEGDGSLFYNHKCRWRDKALLHPLSIVWGTEWNVRQEIVWARDGSLTQNAKMFPPSEERVIWCFKESWRWDAECNQWMSVWRLPAERFSEHPVAYPLEIPLRCIRATTAEGDDVLDPFMGSGTTGLAALSLGRRFLGIEKEPKYFAIAQRRIAAALGHEVREPGGVIQKRMFVP